MRQNPCSRERIEEEIEADEADSAANGGNQTITIKQNRASALFCFWRKIFVDEKKSMPYLW